MRWVVSAGSNNTRKARQSLIDCCFESQVYKCFITLSRLNNTAGDCQTSFNQVEKQQLTPGDSSLLSRLLSEQRQISWLSYQMHLIWLHLSSLMLKFVPCLFFWETHPWSLWESYKLIRLTGTCNQNSCQKVLLEL